MSARAPVRAEARSARAQCPNAVLWLSSGRAGVKGNGPAAPSSGRRGGAPDGVRGRAARTGEAVTDRVAETAAAAVRALARSLRGRLIAAAAGAALLALVAVLALASARGVGGDRLGEVDAGIDRAAEFRLPALGGGEVSIADYAGGPVFLYFWASWCAPCDREAPLIERLWEEFGARGYAFLGVNILDSEREARRFVERHGLSFPTLVDGDGGVYLEFGVDGVPEAFFLAPGLRVERRFVGELRERELRAMLESIGPGPAAAGAPAGGGASS